MRNEYQIQKKQFAKAKSWLPKSDSLSEIPNLYSLAPLRDLGRTEGLIRSVFSSSDWKKLLIVL